MSEPVLRPVIALEEGPASRLIRNPIPPPPKIAWLSLSQLVIDDSYQRSLSEASRRLIRKLVATWDWNCFKPLSVAASGEGVYEVVDGQHTAIAAATHGAIETLPCLVLDATTRAARSAAFVGINQNRLSLTPFALYRARLASGDPEAEAVDAAIAAAGGNLVEAFNTKAAPAMPGTVSCHGALKQIVRRGGKARLARLMRICIAADINPIPGSLLKGLEDVAPTAEAVPEQLLVAALARLGVDTILDLAETRRKHGSATTINEAVAQVIQQQLEKAAA